MGKRYKARERERLVAAVRTSGEPVKVVAERLGVRESTAYYWVKQARRAEPPTFARVIPRAQERSPSLRIDVGGVVIQLDASFDAALLREVVAALKVGAT
jgi:transposase-like protein